MFLYLIELYFLGVVVFTLLGEDLPAAIRSVGGILIGLLFHVLNSLILIGVGLGLSHLSIQLSAAVELAFAFAIYMTRKAPKELFGKTTALTILGVGAGYFAVLFFFYSFNISFISNDSLFLILMGKDVVRTGFTEWYYASPSSMGIYMGLIQAMGVVLGLDYVWFIQPVLSLILIAAFIYFGLKSVSRYIHNKWISLLLVIGALLLFETTNIALVMLTYIHTNLTSGLFLFLVVTSLYFGIEEDKQGWLALAGFALISFGLMRIENVIMALALILIYLSSGKLTKKQSSLTFIPYLVIQGIWYFSLNFMEIDTYLSSMGKIQILLTSLACFAMIVVILTSQIRFIRWILKWAGKLFPYLLLAAWIIFGILKPELGLTNIRALVTNLFVSGHWGSFWVVVLVLLVIGAKTGNFPQKRLLSGFLVSFVAIVEVLGFFRHPYHDLWTDSANRMMIHIVPLVLFLVITQIAKAGAKHQADNEKLNAAGDS